MNLSKRELFTSSVAAGAGLIRERIGLVVLLYVFDITIALLLAIPIYNAVVEHVGYSGFGADLIQGFDLVLWRDIIDAMTDVLQGVGIQLLLVIPIYWIWKTASRMGVIYALHQGAIWPFWRGVGYYTAKGLILGIVFLPVKIIGAGLAIVIGAGLSNIWVGSVGAFWTIGVITPILVISVLSMIDLFQRYARISIVVRHDTIWNALSAGFSWPFKYGAASYVYLLWFMIVAFVFIITQVLNATLHVGISAILVGFLIQQISLFTRSAAEVGWIGSEVDLFERTYINELPLIADAEDIEMPEDLRRPDAGSQDAQGGLAFT